MRLISYMTAPHKSEGHWTWWRDAVSMALADEVGRLLGATVHRSVLPEGGGPFYADREYKFDLGFLPFGWYPADKKPIADWVYTFASDVQGYEGKMRKWMETVKPDFIGCLQDMPPWLYAWMADHNCMVARFPWWTIEPPPGREAAACKRDVQVFTSGATGRSYPMRTKLSRWLNDNMHSIKGQVRISTGPFGNYPMRRAEYLSTLNRARYYLTAGIHDRLVPPKYVEVAGHGCTIVTPDMPWLADLGFIDGETCRTFKTVDDLADILNGDSWTEIMAQAGNLAYTRHTTVHRAELLKGYFCERMDK